jgi:hypothetical protein
MTANWGPMGWMTLHSIGSIYPDEPSNADKLICSRFLELFGETITCRFCKDHYTKMLATYKNIHPEFLNSKRDLFLFTVRAHNTVNKRLDKPTMNSIADAISTLQNVSLVTPPETYRKNYIFYLIRNWAYDTTGEGMFAKQKSRELERINNEYWNLRNGDYNLVFEEADTLELIQESSSITSSSGISFHKIPPINVGFRGGKLRLALR